MFNITKAIYVILDTEIIKKNKLAILSLGDKLCCCGVDILQLRAKNLTDKELLDTACKLRKIIHKRKKIFIVNDRVDIAYLSKADGLHLGKNDIPPKEARKILGRKKLIGKTAHSLKELKSFQNENVDYLGIGPIFRTKTKPALPPLEEKQLKKMLKNAEKSIFAIGGINMYNISSLSKWGINNAAICRGIILNKDMKNTVRRIKECLAKAS